MHFDVWQGDEFDWVARAAAAWATVNVIEIAGPFELELTEGGKALVQQVIDGTPWDSIDLAQILLRPSERVEILGKRYTAPPPPR